MRAWMDDEQPVVQQLQIWRCLRFVEFIGQGLIKEVQPPDSLEVRFGDPTPVSGQRFASRPLKGHFPSATTPELSDFARVYAVARDLSPSLSFEWAPRSGGSH